VSNDLSRDLGRLEAKVDLLLERTHKFSEQHDKLDERIDKLEHGVTASKTTIAIVAGAIGTASGIAVAFAEKIFKVHL
jgi:peptidoglycan hydrolase CwlO-like protein